MNFNDLTIFKTIYEEQTINKAAKKLGYAQSNITARLHAMENECNTALFVRNYTGVTPTTNGEEFYSFILTTLSSFEELKQNFTKEKPKLLTSELLLKHLIMEKQLISIKSTKITCKTTGSISSELNKKHYDSVVTFQKLNRPDYILTAIHELFTNFVCSDTTHRENNLPILINSDTSCPLRKLTLKLIKETERLVEIDSLETILHLVSKGEATALLPTYLEKEGFIPIDGNIFKIKFYSYQYKR
jgi:DNA-binding transcriptional LysR family regulator